MSSWLKRLSRHRPPASLNSRNEPEAHTHRESQISHFGGEKKKKLQSVSWLGTKNILARAKQKGRKTESNNFSWSSGRLGWSTARCSLLPRSNRKSYQTQTLNNSRSASVWECWDVLASEMWNRTIAATQRRMRSLLLLPFVTQNQAPSYTYKLFLLMFRRKLTRGTESRLWGESLLDWRRKNNHEWHMKDDIIKSVW